MIDNVDEIKAQANIEQVVDSLGIKNIKYGWGSEARGDCPFEDHRKSERPFCINLATGEWICQACSRAGGDIIQLVMDVKSMTFPDATSFVSGYSRASIESVESYRPATKLPRKLQSDSKPKLTPQQIEQKLEELEPLDLEQSHPYLKDKCVDPCEGLYQGNDYKGIDSVVVPLRDINGVLQTGQYVHSGPKPFFTGSSTLGAFFAIGSFKDGDTVYLAEGLATALTIWMALNKSVPVISFCSANNMTHTINALKGKYPSIKPIVCLDFNSEAFKHALKIDSAYGCSYRLPSFEGLINHKPEEKLADFNDLVEKCQQPLTIVREQLMIEKLISDLPITKKEITLPEQKMTDAVALKADAEPSRDLISDLEIDIINFIAHKSYNQICDEGFVDDGDFDLDLFNGSTVKDGKESISINRISVECIKKLWIDDQERVFSITDIALRAEKHEENVYGLLNKITSRSVHGADEVKKRLSKLKEKVAFARIEDTFNKLRKAGAISPAAYEELNQVIELGRVQMHVLHSNEHYLASMIEKKKNNDKPFIATPFSDLNLLLQGGLRGGKLITFQGKAGAGKSTCMMQIRDYLAKMGTPVVFVAMEQTREELFDISIERIKADIYDKRKAECEALKSDNKSEKQLAYDPLQKASEREYSSFCKNIFDVEGTNHITMLGSSLSFLKLSTIRGFVLNAIKQTGKKPVLFIDPFQRLSTGYKDLDSNEYDKINALVALLKHLAIKLDITIIMASDVTKDHESKSDGEGSGRGTYMIQHLSDVIITFKESENSAFEAMYGFMLPAKDDTREPGRAAPTPKTVMTRQQSRVKTFLDKELIGICLKSDFETYVSAVVSKNRGGPKYSPIFIYQKSKNRFMEIPMWGKIYPSNNEY